MKCPNKASEDWKQLVEKYGEFDAMKLYVLNNEDIPTLEQAAKLLPDSVLQQRVDYNLKLVDALSRLQRNRFESGKLQGWLNDLQKQGVPKEQIDMFKESAKEGMTKDEILSSILANYSYSVEINTAKSNEEKQVKQVGDNEEFTFNGSIYEYKNNEYLKDSDVIGIIEYESAKHEAFINPNTSYYSNLTAPGGTNYTENEISTPLITPNIKGHAQFSTDQGIGWFRSDEALVGGKNKQVVGEYADEYYENLYERAVDELGYEGTLEEFRKSHDTIGSNAAKTRRILEVQSDLFQKGRDQENLIGEVYIIRDAFKNELYGRTTSKREADIMLKDLSKQWDKPFYIDDLTKYNENQFLQLLNKDNNWVTFFIKSIIQDSAKKGYEKVLFPRGETAAKVEGHETIASEIERIDKQIKVLEDRLDKGEFEYSTMNKYGVNIMYLRKKDGFLKDGAAIWSDAVDDLTNTSVLTTDITENKHGVQFTYVKVDKSEFKNTIEESLKYKYEERANLKSQGIEKLRPIEAFYEIKVGNILKKQYPTKEVTDEYGNGWVEIALKDQKVIDNRILLQKQAVDPNAKEIPQDFYKKIEIFKKALGTDIEVVLDSSISYMGQLTDQDKDKKLRIKINPTVYTKDTIGHEFGHLLIELIGGVNTPLAKRGLQLLEGTDLERKVKELYSDVSDDILKHEILAQAIGEDSVKLFAEEEKRNAFERWLVRVFERIKRLLGIEKSAVRKLTRMMFDGIGNVDTVSPLSSETYQQRKSELITADKLVGKVVDAVKRKKALYEHVGYRSYIEKLDNLIAETYDKDPNEFLMKFVGFAEKQTKDFYSRYEQEIKKESEGFAAFDISKLKKWDEYLAAFAVLDDIRDFVTDVSSGMVITEENKNRLNETIAKRDFLQGLYVRKGYSTLVDKLMPYTSRTEAEIKRSIEREYRALSKEERAKISLEEYINSHFPEADVVEEKKRTLVETELLKARADINQIYRWADNLLDSNDTIIQAAVNMLVTKDEEARLVSNNIKNKIVDSLRELETVIKHNSFEDEKKFYDFILDKDETGQPSGYLISPYKSTLVSAYYKMLSESNEIEDPNKKRIYQNNWYKMNAPLNTGRYRKNLSDFLDQLVIENKITISDKTLVLAQWDSDWYSPLKDKTLTELIGAEKADFVEDRISDIKWASRDINSKYRSKEWEKFESLMKINPLDPRVKFYNLITKLSDEADSNLPNKYKLNFHGLLYRIPSVGKDTRERIKDKGLKGFIEGQKAGLVKRQEDIERGQQELVGENNQPIDFVPIFYTQQLPIDDMSFDLATSYLRFASMAAHYGAKMEILPEMELARYFIKNREVIKTDSKGNPIKNALKQLADVELTKNGQQSLLAAQFDDWFKTIMYGQSKADEGDLNILGLKVDKGKAMDMLGKYSAFNLLALNVIQGFGNVLLGETMQAIEAFAGQYMTKKAYTAASLQYAEGLPKLMGDIGSRKPNSLLGVINEHFNVVNEGVDPLRRNNIFRNLLKSDTLFFMQHAGEFEMQMRFFLGMLNDLDAKDKDDKVLGKMINFLSAKNGELHVDPKVANFTEKEQILFGQKVKRVLSRMHGEYSNYGAVALQRYGIGRLVLAFRKFIIPGFKRRWARESYNEFLGDFTEGNYITTAKFFRKLLKDIKHFKVATASAEWDKLTRAEKANIHRTISEIMFMTTAIILSTIFLSLAKEADDDSEDKKWSFAAYQASRYMSELQFFVNPLAALSILRSPMASMSVVENSVKLLSQLAHPTETYERGPWKDQLKLKKDLINLTIGVRQYYRLRDIEQQLSYFNQ